ncbi:MAG: hypothetical protein KKF44_07755 [Nanoarchaeota archaeon]|nr:hypothetical protein [Nanoarchaeota archaeon]
MTIMTYNHGPPFKFNPVSAKLIEDALLESYNLYLSKQYPHKCEDIADLANRELCIAKIGQAITSVVVT